MAHPMPASNLGLFELDASFKSNRNTCPGCVCGREEAFSVVDSILRLSDEILEATNPAHALLFAVSQSKSPEPVLAMLEDPEKFRGFTHSTLAALRWDNKPAELLSALFSSMEMERIAATEPKIVWYSLAKKIREQATEDGLDELLKRVSGAYGIHVVLPGKLSAVADQDRLVLNVFGNTAPVENRVTACRMLQEIIRKALVEVAQAHPEWFHNRVPKAVSVPRIAQNELEFALPEKGAEIPPPDSDKMPEE